MSKNLELLHKQGFDGDAEVGRMMFFSNMEAISIHRRYSLKHNEFIWVASVSDMKYSYFDCEAETLIEAVAGLCVAWNEQATKTGTYAIG